MKIKNILLFSMGVFVLLLIWEILSRSSKTIAFIFSSPALIYRYILQEIKIIIKSFYYTGLESIIGFMIAIIVSIIFGTIFALRKRLAMRIYPILVFSQVIPLVCFAPFIIMVMGNGWAGKMLLSSVMCFFPIIASLIVGQKRIPNDQIDYIKLSCASKRLFLKHVVIPYSLPNLFGGLRVAAPFSVVGAVVAEFNGAYWGIGKDIFIGAKRAETESIIIGIICSAILAAIIYGIVILIENRLGDWYFERRLQ